MPSWTCSPRPTMVMRFPHQVKGRIVVSWEAVKPGVKRKLASVLHYITSPLHLVMHIYPCQFYSKSYGHCGFGVSGPQNPVHGSHLPAYLSHYTQLRSFMATSICLWPLLANFHVSFLKRYRAPAWQMWKGCSIEKLFLNWQQLQVFVHYDHHSVYIKWLTEVTTNFVVFPTLLNPETQTIKPSSCPRDSDCLVGDENGKARVAAVEGLRSLWQERGQGLGQREVLQVVESGTCWKPPWGNGNGKCKKQWIK